MGKKHKLRIRHHSEGTVTPLLSPGKTKLFTSTVCWLLGCLFGCLLTIGVFQIANHRFATITANRAPTIPTIVELLTMPPERLANQDIAVLNLSCAEGLPGAEKLEIVKCLRQLDSWAAQVKEVTERHLYRVTDPRYADHYQHSEAVLRAEFLCQVLQEDLGVHYDMGRVNKVSFRNSKDLFIHGMISDSNGGTCASMPVLYAAVGRRLGYPIKLATTWEHLFNRWEGLDSLNPNWRQRFNFESTGPGFSTFADDYYKKWPKIVTDEEVKSCGYLKTLTPAEELAEFLADRGHCLLDNDRLHDAQLAYGFAHQLAPDSRLMLAFFSDSVGQEVARLSAPANALTMQRMPNDSDADVARVEAINAARRQQLDGEWRQTMPSRTVGAYTPDATNTGKYPPN